MLCLETVAAELLFFDFFFFLVSQDSQSYSKPYALIVDDDTK